MKFLGFVKKVGDKFVVTDARKPGGDIYICVTTEENAETLLPTFLAVIVGDDGWFRLHKYEIDAETVKQGFIYQSDFSIPVMPCEQQIQIIRVAFESKMEKVFEFGMAGFDTARYMIGATVFECKLAYNPSNDELQKFSETIDKLVA